MMCAFESGADAPQGAGIMRRRGTFIVIVSVAAVLGTGAARGQEGSTATDLSKPLAQFTIGDIVPNTADGSMLSLGSSWKASAASLRRIAEDRLKVVDIAIEEKKVEIAGTKSALKTAKRAKDFVQTGSLQGTLKHDQVLVGVLEEMRRISISQIDVAKAWNAAGQAIDDYLGADRQFEPVRARRIAKPEPGSDTDERMGAADVGLFRTQARALERLGASFRNLGSLVENSAALRLSLVTKLEKGGHVQTPN